MKHIKLYESFVNEENLNPEDSLKKFYNGIMNDYSIQRNTMQWKDVIDLLDKLFKKKIELDKNVQFDNKLVVDALNAAADLNNTELEDTIEVFAKELHINLETLRNKK